MSDTGRKVTAKGRPRAEAGEDRRERILDSALELFAERGVNATTDTQIGRASGVTPAMVHYYFHNRDGLLDALVAERLAPNMRYIWEGLDAGVPADPRWIVTTLVRRLLDVVERLPQLPSLWNREVFHRDGCLRSRIMAHLPAEAVACVFAALARAKTEGTLNPRLQPELVVVSAFGMLMLPLAAGEMFETLTGVRLRREALAEHVLGLLLGGVGGTGGEER